MAERVKKTLDFLREQYEKPAYFRQHPDQKNYRFEHSIRVANIAAQIARAEGMDEKLLTVAGLLHDVGYGQDFPADYDWNEHGRDGARIARPFLESLGLSEAEVNDVCFAIAIHVDDKADFEGRRCPFTETVGDADNIDRFDAYRIYETVRFQMKPEEHSLSENLDWLRRRLERLEKLKTMSFATAAATQLWREKVEYQIGYFSRLLNQMEMSMLQEER